VPGTTLVTGATGFVGRHLVAALLRAGDGPLRILARGRAPWTAADGVEVVRGDVASAEDVDRAMAGVARVYHLAGAVSRDPADKWRLMAAHVEGTRNVCRAALRGGVERVVHVSSSGTIAVSERPVVFDETADYKPSLLAPFPYYLAKLYAEAQVLSAFAADRLPVVVVSPGLVLGPGGGPASSLRDVAAFLRGQVPVAPTGGATVVDVRDVADGLVAAMARGRPGERYLLAGSSWTFRRLFDVLARISGRRPPVLLLPTPLLRAGTGAARRLARVVGASYDVDDATVRMSGLFWYCDGAKARGELGFAPRAVEDTLRDTVADLRRQGVG
jgi:dihydroflavonol-4-reductase